MKTILLTGCAGFIGSHVAGGLLASGHRVVGIDNLNEYYDSRLKSYRLKELQEHSSFRFVKDDVQHPDGIDPVFREEPIEAIIHLAAMAGIRYSQERPEEYVATNVAGTLAVLRLAQRHRVNRFVFASSSSVYSGTPVPFREDSITDTPISVYGATKRSGELMVYTYHATHGMHASVLRYFTVYGPKGRPDMSYFKFIRSLDEGKPILVHGDGNQTRDLTFVGDVARATVSALDLDGFHILNIAGGREPVSINAMIAALSDLTGKKANVQYGDPLNVDLPETRADISIAKKLLHWSPRVDFPEGIRSTVDWHLRQREFIRKLRP